VPEGHEIAEGSKGFRKRADAEQALADRGVAGQVAKVGGKWFPVVPSKSASALTPRADAGGTAHLSDAEFAQQVQGIADEQPNGFGDNKVFLGDVFDRMKERHPGLTRAEFDRRMLAADAADRLTMSRADLVQLMHSEDVSRGEIRHPLGRATYHMMLAKNGKRRTRQPDEPDRDTGLLGPDATLAEVGRSPHRARRDDPRHALYRGELMRFEDEDHRLSDHRRHVEAALALGKPVPAEVLADYPDLAAKYAKPDTGTAAAPVKTRLQALAEKAHAQGTPTDDVNTCPSVFRIS
jgi:hypothetical protein